MLSKPQRGFFVTGTDTEVGKTFVTALLARRLRKTGVRVGVYKPVASGCPFEEGQLIAEDAVRLWEAAGRPLTLSQVCPQRFAAPLAPHLAAKAEDKQVDAALLQQGISVWTDACDLVLVEGVGGLLSPISDADLVANLASEFGYPLLIVARNALGVINQTLQTLVAAEHYGLPVAGIVLNDVHPTAGDPSTESNREEINRLAKVPMLGHVRHVGLDGPQVSDREIDFIVELTRANQR